MLVLPQVDAFFRRSDQERTHTRGKFFHFFSFGRFTRTRLITLVVLAGWLLPLPAVHLEGAESSPSRSPQDTHSELKAIKTLLVTGSLKSWLEGDQPTYNVPVTLKLKLEDAGFAVVFDPALPHDANLRIDYEEYPSGQFQVLEEATAVTYSLRLLHARLGEIFFRQFDAAPNPTPITSLYWDTIANLEENPHYYFVGDILWKQLQQNMNERDALLHILMKPYSQSPGSPAPGPRHMDQAGVLERARLNIIQALGQEPFDTDEAHDILWTLARKARHNERYEAITQIGKIGNQAFLPGLTELLQEEQESDLRSAVEHAIQVIESR